MEVKTTLMKRATRRFLTSAALMIALMFATVSAFAADTPFEPAGKNTVTKQDVSQTTAPATVIDATTTDTRFIGYAERCTASVERLDVNWNNVRLPEAPSQEIGHVPLY